MLHFIQSWGKSQLFHFTSSHLNSSLAIPSYSILKHANIASNSLVIWRLVPPRLGQIINMRPFFVLAG